MTSVIQRAQVKFPRGYLCFVKPLAPSSWRWFSNRSERNDRKRIVVILPWLKAPPSAVKKYEDLYAKRGFESIVYCAGVRDFLWPKTGLESSLQVLEKLQGKMQENGAENAAEIVIHSFSVGCYLYSLMIWQMRKNPEEYHMVWDGITAQVCDSPVVGTLNEMANGIAKMISPKSKIIARAYKSLCMMYFGLTKSHVALYDELISTFKYHAPRVPSMIVTSENDPMRIPEAFDDLCKCWSKNQMIFRKVWADSGHAQHLRFHPEEYEDLIEKLLVASKNSDNI